MTRRQEPSQKAGTGRCVVVASSQSRFIALASFLTALAIAIEPAYAQRSSIDTYSESTVEGLDTNIGTVVYDGEFFAKYNATTAAEILRRIPGVTAILDDTASGSRARQRGFGSVETQILINGRRLAGKSIDVGSALNRIQIRNLDRIELIRGATEDVDVRSSGVVINLVLKSGDALTSSGFASVMVHMDESGTTELDGALGLSSEVGNLDYFISFDKTSYTEDKWGSYSRRYRDEKYYFSTGKVRRTRKTTRDRKLDEYTIAANSTYHFADGDSLQFNALVKPSKSIKTDITPFIDFALDGTPEYSATDIKGQVIGRRMEWEVGATYDRNAGSATNFKLLSVINYDKKNAEDFWNRIEGGVLKEVSRNPADNRESEAIIRGSFSWALSTNQAIEIGAEIVQNSLEQINEAFFDLNEDGQAEQIDIFDPSSKVEEIRTEVFINHNLAVNSRWTAATSVVVENSEISQRGVDINNKTGFNFIKPRIDVRYSPNANDQLRVKLERTASQLNFSNFVPKYQILLDRFMSGNPDLQPETAWEYEVGFEHRFADDEGVIEARVFYSDIQDRIESVALDLDGDGRFRTASGNIGDGIKYGFALNFGWRMKRLGIPNLLVDGRFLRQESRVMDPFSGTEREFGMTQDYVVDLNVRHDISRWNIAYGANYHKEGGPFAEYEWREHRRSLDQPQVNLFLQKKIGDRWTSRIDAIGITRNKAERSREIYADNATTGAIGQHQFYAETRDRRYTVSLTATF